MKLNICLLDESAKGGRFSRGKAGQIILFLAARGNPLTGKAAEKDEPIPRVLHM